MITDFCIKDVRLTSFEHFSNSKHHKYSRVLDSSLADTIGISVFDKQHYKILHNVVIMVIIQIYQGCYWENVSS